MKEYKANGNNSVKDTDSRGIVLGILYIVLFIAIFALIQFLFSYGMTYLAAWLGGSTAQKVAADIATGSQANLLIASSVLSSVLTICLFAKVKWAPISRNYLRSKPWGVFFWAAVLALGSILPSEWLVEQMQYNMPEATEKLFEQIMGKPTGYLAIGILGPLAEEMVFRGAVLRTLLKMMDGKWHWVAIIISALIFGAVHGNAVQFVHASVLGLLLGWMYYRTNSILPGVIFHWVNNTVAYVMFNIMPQMADGKLIDLFHGDSRMMVLGIFFSLCIFIPGVLQLNMRMKK